MSSSTYQAKEHQNSARSQEQTGTQATFQFKDNRPEAVAQRKLQETIAGSLQVNQRMANPIAQLEEKSNNTGLPDQLKAGVESLSGMSLDHVKVHYNSDKPAQLNAHAYAQGSDIHVASGQEKHLPHEAWHVVQQAQGRVQPTTQLKASVPVNDDAKLETEADQMGTKALSLGHTALQRKEKETAKSENKSVTGVIQRKGADIGKGLAELFVPDIATTTVSIFGHGVYNNDFDEIAGMTIGYYCPHQSALNSNPTMIENDTLYDAGTGAPDVGKWHNYTLKDAHAVIEDDIAKGLCNDNASAFALIRANTSTREIAELLYGLGYRTIKAIHCREVNGADNKEWDPVSDSEVVVAKATEKVTRASLNGKWDVGSEKLIDDSTDVIVDFMYMDDEHSWATGKKVTEVDGTNLTVEKMG